MPTHRPYEPDAEHRRAVHKLFEAVFAFAWRALGRYGLPAADRDDIAQNVAIAALRRWPTYREESGTPGQWLWGIVRNELRVFLRAQGRQPVPAGDDLFEVPSDAPSPEEGAALHDLADHLLSTLPVEQRRVVLLHEIVGLTYREIAALEGISKSEAHDRHRTGMRALAAAAYRSGDQPFRGVALLPIALADLTGDTKDGGAPPSEACDAAWQRAAQDLGAAEPSPACSIPSPPKYGRLPRAGWSWLRRLAPIGLALLGGLAAGPWLQRFAFFGARGGSSLTMGPQAAPNPEILGIPASASAAAPVSLEARTPAGTATVSAPDVATSNAADEGGPSRSHPPAPQASPMPRPTEPAPAARAAVRADDNAEALAEQALMDQGRTGLASGRPEQAIAAFAEHARRFPRGAFAGERDRLWSVACTQRSTEGAPAQGCAGRAQP